MADLNKLDSSLIDEISDILEKPKSMTTQAAMRIQLKLMSQIWQSQNELIDHIRVQNGRIGKNENAVAELKKKNIITWISENKTKALGVFIGIFALNSVVNWAGIRRPLLQAVGRLFGVEIPLELIP